MPFLTGIEGGARIRSAAFSQRGTAPGFEAGLADELPLIDVE